MLQAGLVEIVQQPKPRPIAQPTLTQKSAKPEATKEIEQQSPSVKRSIVVRLIDRIRGL
jgi:hypothetical protein